MRTFLHRSLHRDYGAFHILFPEKEEWQNLVLGDAENWRRKRWYWWWWFFAITMTLGVDKMILILFLRVVLGADRASRETVRWKEGGGREEEDEIMSIRTIVEEDNKKETNRNT